MEILFKDDHQTWRQDFKIIAATLICLGGVVLFFSADNLVGALMLQAFYFQYGIVIAGILMTVLIVLVMHWAAFPDPIVGKVIGVGIFVMVTAGFLAFPRVRLIAGLLSGFVISIGLYCFVPVAFFSWVVVAFIAWMRGWLRLYLTEPLFFRAIVMGLFVFTASYTMLRYVQSLDFNIITHHEADSLNYYTVSMTSISSGIITKIVEYKCNEISLYCTETLP